MTTKKHPILLVDDEPEILYSLQGLLRREFELFTAQSGAEALEILKQQSIHVIMTDQRMPEMTGVELLRRAQGEWPQAIRIVFTGYADIKAVVDAVNQGRIYRYLIKPWDPEELIGVLYEACTAYDRAAERERLLVDLQDYLARYQPVLESLAGQAEIVDTARAGRELLARLGRVLQERVAGGETE